MRRFKTNVGWLKECSINLGGKLLEEGRFIRIVGPLPQDTPSYHSQLGWIVLTILLHSM